MPEALVVDHCDSSILHLVSTSSQRLSCSSWLGHSRLSDELTTMPRGARVEACRLQARGKPLRGQETG